MRARVGAYDYVFPWVKERGDFHVDEMGRVWTCRKKGNWSPHLRRDKTRWWRAEWISPQDRAMILAYDSRKVFVSRLVWFWFNGPIPEGMEVDHIDEDHTNDHPDNLQLLTRAQNLAKRELALGNHRQTEQYKKLHKEATQRSWDLARRFPHLYPARVAYANRGGNFGSL